MRLLTALLLVVALGGCGTTNWVHPSKGQDQLAADAYECERDAAPAQFLATRIGMRERCMQVKGWRSAE